MLKEEAKAKIEELNAQVCAASESTSASIIESQQEEITKHPYSILCIIAVMNRLVYDCAHYVIIRLILKPLTQC